MLAVVADVVNQEPPLVDQVVVVPVMQARVLLQQGMVVAVVVGEAAKATAAPGTLV
jgi:hypothetical protein